MRAPASRVAFGKKISEHSIWKQRIAEARMDIEITTWLSMLESGVHDGHGGQQGRAGRNRDDQVARRIALRIIDEAIQAFGGGGVCEDLGLAPAHANTRIVRLTDGPDEVHCKQIALLELAKHVGKSYADIKACS